MNKYGNYTGKHTRQVSYEEMKEYGDFIRTMRESISMSTSDFANELGIFRTTLVRWERGQTIPQRDISEIIDDVRYIVKQYNKRKQKEVA